MEHSRSSLFPLSIKNYSIGFTVVTLLIFVSLAWFVLHKVYSLHNDMQDKNTAIAAEELESAVENSIKSAGYIANKFALWEETIQQINNPVYYSYWRANRVKEAGFLQDYFVALELYDKSGMPLSNAVAFSLLPEIDPNNLGAFIAKRNNKTVLYYVSPIYLADTDSQFFGYVAVELNFKQVLSSVQKFRQLSSSSLTFGLDNNVIVPASDIYSNIEYSIISNKEFNALEKVMADTLLQFAIVGMLSIVGFLYIIFVLMGKPLALLSLHIDAMGSGRHDYLEPNGAGFYFVLEFNKLRISLNDYTRQIEQLERVAAGDVNDVISVDTDKEVGGLMSSFNAIVKQLQQTIEEKDSVSLQLRSYADELRKVSDQALAANRAKSVFLANMSHEIRTPLTAIIGFAEASLDNQQTMSERQDALSIIVKSGQHLLQIINDILDLSKVEVNKLEIEHIPVSTFQLVSELESLIRLQAKEKGLEFNVNYVLPLPLTIYSDPIRIKQVIINLCNNAIKFTTSGYVHLNIRSDILSELISFEIVDTGIGLSEEHVDKIFKPFTQADSSTTRKYGGTGLGLSLSRQLAVMLGGSLSAKSKLGAGSQFMAEFAVGEVHADDYVHEESQLPKVSQQPALLENHDTLAGHVLVAEDVLENQKLITLYLSRMGITSTVVGNGKLAVEQAESANFDLIIMDIQMPEMDGLEATSLLRRAGCTIPIIALTANAFKEDEERCINAGYTHYLPKPIDRQKLYHVLESYLPHKKSVSESTSPIYSLLLGESIDFKPLIEKFVGNLHSDLSKISEAYAQGDWQALGKLLHALKGTGANMGYPMLGVTVASMELHLADKNYKRLNDAVEELCGLCERIKLGVDSGEPGVEVVQAINLANAKS